MDQSEEKKSEPSESLDTTTTLPIQENPVPKESLRRTIYLRSRNKKKRLHTIIEEEVIRTDSK